MSDVIIRKKNEVYLQVKTPPHITYELSDHFTFEVEGAKFMPAYRNKHWDGKIRLFLQELVRSMLDSENILNSSVKNVIQSLILTMNSLVCQMKRMSLFLSMVLNLL